jgi:RNA polymerase sigma-32 factor
MGERMRGECSLDAEIADGDGYTLLEGLADDRMNQEELLSEHQEALLLKREVTVAMGSLNEKERFIVEHRVTADDPMTLQEIADSFSISRERVRQIEENALKKMKSILTPLIAHTQTA